MAVIATLAANVTARTRKFERGMKRAIRSVRRFAGAVKGSLGIGGLGAGASFITLGRSTEFFNRAMRESQAIMGDLSDEIKKSMIDTALEAAKVTKFSSKEIAKAYFFLASAGLDAAQSIKALPVVASFAQAGMFDMARATDLLTDAQSALGLTVKDASQNMLNMSRVGDVLVKANTLANASVQQFSEALTTKAGAAIKFLNKDIEEGVAVLAAFADQGLKAAEAGTAFNIVIRDLTTKALKNAEAFKKSGIAVFDASGKMNNIADIIEDVENRLDGMSDAAKKATLLQLGFADKSVVFLQTLLGMSKRIREYEAGLRSAANTMQEVADRQLTPFQKAWAQISTAITKVGIALKPVWDAFAAWLSSVTPMVDVLTGRIGTLTEELGGTAKATVRLDQRMTDAFTGVLKAGAIVIDIVSSIGTAFWGLSGTIGVVIGGAAKIVSLFAEKLTALINIIPGVNVKISEEFKATADAIVQVSREMLGKSAIVAKRAAAGEAQQKLRGFLDETAARREALATAAVPAVAGNRDDEMLAVLRSIDQAIREVGTVN